MTTPCKITSLVFFTGWCLAAVSAVTFAATRTWTDSTGKHSVEAEFVKLEDGKLTLRKADGEEVTLPLDRLSPKDRELAEQLAAKASGAQAPPRADREAIGEVAEKFFDALRAANRDRVRDAITTAARTSYDAGQSKLRELPAPDRGRVRASRVSIEGDTATAEVTVRLRGQSQRTKLHFRQESDKWLVHAITAPGPEGEPLTISFEGDGPGAADVAGAVAATVTVPDGDARELLKFMDEAVKKAFGEASSPEEARERAKGLFAAILTASDKVLESEATPAQKKDALTRKIQALQLLTSLGVPGMSERLATLPKDLDRLGLEEFKPLVHTFVLTAQLGDLQSLTAPQARRLIEQAVKHLHAMELSPAEIQLAQSIADVAEMLDSKLAADVNQQLGTLLSASKEKPSAAIGARMLGTARRLGLVGNRMELTGVMLDGSPFDLTQYEGKVVLVDFWATWCGPCMEEMPNIRQNYEQYHSKGFEVVAISVDRDLAALRQYVQQETPPWMVLADYHPKVGDDRRMSAYYGVSGIPTTILVGADGKVVSLSCRGSQLGAQLQRLLGPAG